MRTLFVIGFAVATGILATAQTPEALSPGQPALGGLPRAGNRPLEAIPGLEILYDVLTTRDGVRLRTILTKPVGATGPLPAILFVQWLSCDSIELPASAQGGWSRMMRRVASESRAVMMRVEKRGVGDSEGGPCSALDYETELADHREALRALKSSPLVDPRRIVVFGASIGGTYAPLVVRGEEIAGVVVWGAGARSWFERMLAFERNFRELSGPGETLTEDLKRVSAFLSEYLQKRRNPRQIAADTPALATVWQTLVGTEGDLHYGRPTSFHQQAHHQDWARAWSQVRSPVLVLLGEYDWYEDPGSAQLIARLVNRNAPGRARFITIPATDHHFTRYATREEAVKGSGGKVNEEPAVREILSWFRAVTG
ncbi:MAG TPA: alpha/beta hydrolase [Vicinamibacterales bacterium]|nr:alpha/beta hydrolase [Vicinamibacterales bacterium]